MQKLPSQRACGHPPRACRICHPHPQHTSMRIRLEHISSARPWRCFEYVVGLLTLCLKPLLTRCDRDFRGGWLRFSRSATINTTTQGRQQSQTLNIERCWALQVLNSKHIAYTLLCGARGHSSQPNFATSRCPSPQHILGSGPSRVSEQARARTHKQLVRLDTNTRSIVHSGIVSTPSAHCLYRTTLDQRQSR